MKKEIYILIETEEIPDYEEAYQVIFNAADDLGEVVRLVIRDPTGTSSRDMTKRIEKLLARPGQRTKRPLSFDMTRLRAALGPKVMDVRPHLDWLVANGKVKVTGTGRAMKWTWIKGS